MGRVTRVERGRRAAFTPLQRPKLNRAGQATGFVLFDGSGPTRISHSGFDGRGASGVAQVSKSAVSPISKSAGYRNGVASARLETRDTADLEVCATGLAVKYPG